VNSIQVRKASGESEVFQERKLIRSLRKAGAKLNVAREVLLKMKPDLYDGIPTKVLYQRAFKWLQKLESHAASRYSLKEALMLLGPGGYGFERFMGAILAKEGFETEYDKSLQGRCIWHEVDVVGKRGEEHVLLECKFHNQYGKKCDIKTALYVRARALDLRESNGGEIYSDFRLVTNTKFTSDTEKYATCAGLRLLSWNYPKGGGIKELVTRYHLHPITCLTTLTPNQKQQLLALKIVLCHDLHSDLSVLNRFRLTHGELALVRNELLSLIGQ